MGLDQYLYRETHVVNYEDDMRVELIINDEKLNYIDPTKIYSIKEEVGYWRKSNQIHGWFVNNVQGGEDDCGTYPVSTEQLRELYDVCLQAYNDPDKAPDLLPVTPGFFFGGYGYEENYFNGIKSTIEILESIFETSEILESGHEYIPGDFYYGSSW